MRNKVRRGVLLLCVLVAVLPKAMAQSPSKTVTEKYLESIGMVNVLELDESFQVYMMYATSDNFVGEVLYEDLYRPYLHPLAAHSLVEAHAYLKELYPEYRLKIYDASRPMTVQQKMWNQVKGTSKRNYVSNPKNGGGLHNYGMAIDLTIVDEEGRELPMGTVVDHLGYEANIDNEEMLLSTGILKKDEKRNRELLRSVMRRAGFKTITTEWWHFNRIRRPEARRSYQVIP